jgi:hypothetical protein
LNFEQDYLLLCERRLLLKFTFCLLPGLRKHEKWKVIHTLPTRNFPYVCPQSAQVSPLALKIKQQNGKALLVPD